MQKYLKNLVFIPLCVIVLFAFGGRFSPVFSGYVCRQPQECFSRGGKQVDSTFCGSCSLGQICCLESGTEFTGWQYSLWGPDGPPDTFQILGIELAASELKDMIRTLIVVAVSLLATGLVIVIGYGGFLWITAGDKEEQLQRAQKVIKDGFIAMIIVVVGLLMLSVMAGVLGLDIWNFSFLDDILGG